jgi:plastocyanin
VRLSAIAAVAVVLAGVACSDATTSANPTHATQVSTGPGNIFNPANVTVAVGDTVFFIVGGGHNVTWTTAGAPEGCIGVCPRVFPTKGTFYYVCTPHASLGMVGSVTVQ